MRVLLVVTADGRGGSEKQSRLLAAALTEAGATVDVWVLEGNRGQPFAANHTKWLGVDRRVTLRSILRGTKSLVELLWVVNSKKYDVIHAVMARAHTAVPLLRTGKGPAVVAWRRNLGIHSRHKVMRRVENLAAHRTDMLIANADEVLEYWKSRTPRRKGSEVVIGNILIPTVIEEYQPSYNGTRPLRIVSVGGLKAVKRFDNLITAVSKMNVATQLTIVGEGPERDGLTRLADRLEVDLNLPGHLDNISEALTHSDIYVQSSDSEGLSNALLEAVVHGVPAVATSVGGTRSVLGKYIHLVQPGNPDELAATLGDVARTYRNTFESARVAQKNISARFSPREVAMQHIFAYSEAMLEVARRKA